MCTAKQYLVKAAEFTELLKKASSPAEMCKFRNLEQGYVTLAENDEWMVNNRDKTNSPQANDNLYSDIIRARQEKNTTPFTEFSIKMRQLFDEAESKGGQLQSAALLGQFARFLRKHTEDGSG